MQVVGHELTDLEGFQLLHAGEPELLQDRAGRRALQCQCGDLLGDFGDGDVEAARGIEQPVDLPLGGAQPVFVLAQPEDRAVVDHVAAGRRTRRNSRPGSA